MDIPDFFTNKEKLLSYDFSLINNYLNTEIDNTYHIKNLSLEKELLVDYFKSNVSNKKILMSLDFNKTKSFNEINKLRKILVDNYGMYASGEKNFGEKIYMKYDATPENYNVYIELDNGEVYSDTIDVRNDPIKSNLYLLLKVLLKSQQ